MATTSSNDKAFSFFFLHEISRVSYCENFFKLCSLVDIASRNILMQNKSMVVPMVLSISPNLLLKLNLLKRYNLPVPNCTNFQRNSLKETQDICVHFLAFLHMRRHTFFPDYQKVSRQISNF